VDILDDMGVSKLSAIKKKKKLLNYSFKDIVKIVQATTVA